jgi:Uma2 family endonuclease
MLRRTDMAATGQLTLDEFLRLPEEKTALEYERGVIPQKMAPMAWHGKLQYLLCMRFEQQGHPTRLHQLKVNLDEDVVVRLACPERSY